MAQNRPDKPQITLPDDFGGTQEPFSSSLVESGYEASIPQIIEGGNLNWMLNGFFQNTKYMRTVLDYVRDTPVGKMFWVNSQGQMDYVEPAIIATNTEFSTGTATDKSPNVKQVVDKFATKSDDNTVVKLTGNQTITGVKTFTNSMTTGNIFPEGDITLGTSTNTWGKQLQFRDTTGKRIARIQPMAIDTTNNRVGMWVNNADNTVEKGIYVDSNGTTSAPTPTDTTTTTGTQIATTGWVNSTDNNVVHKTGYETIGGEKNFTSNLARINTNFTKGTNPSTTYYNAVEFTDKNGIGNINRVGMLETSIAANGLISTYITAYKYANNSTNNARIAVIYPTSGNPYTEAPASDVSGSIVTTVNKSKAANGYFQLGNGLIIQWGRIKVSVSNSHEPVTVITFPKAFTTTNYSLTGTFETNTSTSPKHTDDVSLCTRGVYTTSINVFGYDAGGNTYEAYLRWIAIGY